MKPYKPISDDEQAENEQKAKDEQDAILKDNGHNPEVADATNDETV